MSILIPGMEMPDNCYNNCPFFTQIQPGIDHGLINYCCLENWKKPITPLAFSVDKAKQGRQPFCPLIPVPEHGDLVERQAVLNTFSIHMNRTRHFVTIRDAVPTIIPADHIGDANEMVADKEGEL